MKNAKYYARAVVALAVLAGFLALAGYAQSAESYTAIIAQQIALVTIEPSPAPPSPPGPAPGVCSNCKGTGRLGDGTISVPCPVCGGDGKIESDAKQLDAISRQMDAMLFGDPSKKHDERPAAERAIVSPPATVQQVAPVRRGLLRRRGGG